MKRFLIFILLLNIIKTDIIFTEHPIDASYTDLRTLSVADLDNDGDVDIISAWFDSAPSGWTGEIVWHENDGTGSLTEHLIIDENEFQNCSKSILPIDIDKDGDMDILTIHGCGECTLVWHENDGNGLFISNIIDQTCGDNDDELSFIFSLDKIYVLDYNNDGYIDILATTSYLGYYGWGKIIIYKNNGSNSFTEKLIVFSDNIAVRDVYPVDLNGDGNIDIIAAWYESGYENYNKLGWYENNGNDDFTEHIVSNVGTDLVFDWHNNGYEFDEDYADIPVGILSVHSADLDNDGDMDIISSGELNDKIVWFENDGNAQFNNHTITNNVDGAKFVKSSDLDNDGDLDILSISEFDNKISWFENDGNASFIEYTITTTSGGSNYIEIVDFDNDGKSDILSSAIDDDKIIWYQQVKISGCMNIDGCNYNINATIDDESCIFPENDGSGNMCCSSEHGCDGICNSGITMDECGICGGDNSICTDCEETLNPCGWGLTNCEDFVIIDECGICGGDNSCFGCTDSSACNYDGAIADGWIDSGSCEYIVDCENVCGGNTVLDCLGVCGGNTEEDECGICGGDGINSSACDCDGNVFDSCGNCGANDNSCALVNITIENVNTNDGTLDIYMTNSIPVAGFQFVLTGITPTGGFGGAAEANGFTVNSGNMILGFSFTGSSVDVSSGLLTTISFIDYNGESICFSTVHNRIISSTDSNSIPTYWGPCLSVDCLGNWNGDAVIDECDVCNGDNSTCKGCMNESADNFNNNATIPCEDCCEFDTLLFENIQLLPKKFEISDLYPNPFNPELNIVYQVPFSIHVSIDAINIQGKIIQNLSNHFHNAGFYQITWIAKNHQSGIYFIQLKTSEKIITKKVILLK